MATIEDIFDYVILLRGKIGKLENEIQDIRGINEALSKEVERLNKEKISK